MSAANPFFPDLELEDELYSFDHLEPFNMVFTSERISRELELNVRFSNHCFSHGIPVSGIYDQDYLIEGTEGNARIFCPTRYRLSFELPAIIQKMNDPQVKVYQTAERRNFAHVIQIDSPAGPYYVFFELRKNSGFGTDDLKMIVESAYHQDPERPAPRVLGRIGFQTLCTKVFLREQVNTMKKGR